MRNALVFAVTLSISAACDRKQNDQVTAAFDVSIQSISGDCKLPVLDFGSRAAEVGSLIGSNSDNPLYYAINLDPVYSKIGTKLQVAIRKVAIGEERACTTMGPSYQSVVVISAAPK